MEWRPVITRINKILKERINNRILREWNGDLELPG